MASSDIRRHEQAIGDSDFVDEIYDACRDDLEHNERYEAALEAIAKRHGKKS